MSLFSNLCLNAQCFFLTFSLFRAIFHWRPTCIAACNLRSNTSRSKTKSHNTYQLSGNYYWLGKTIRAWQKFLHKPACVKFPVLLCVPFITPVYVVAARNVVPLGTTHRDGGVPSDSPPHAAVGVGLPRHHRKADGTIPRAHATCQMI